MDRLKFYQNTAGILLLLNFSMIVFVFLGKPPARSSPAHEILKMDEGQIKNFKLLVDEHRLQMKTISREQQELLKPYFNTLVDLSKIDRDTMLSQVLQLERQKIEVTFQHFLATKSLLRPDQLDNFEEFIKKVLNRILLEEKKHKRPKDL